MRLSLAKQNVVKNNENTNYIVVSFLWYLISKDDEKCTNESPDVRLILVIVKPI